MTATCKDCESILRGVDRNEDGSPVIEPTPCTHPGCEVHLCRAGCEHLSFQCEGCRRYFRDAHRVVLDGLSYCLGCAVAVVESQEPECECRQAEVDLFDAAGCELHDPASPWNVRLRAVTAVQDYEAEPKSPALRGERCEF